MQRSRSWQSGHFQQVIEKVFRVDEHIARIEKKAGVLLARLDALMQIDTGGDHVANLRKIRKEKLWRSRSCLNKRTHILSGIYHLRKRINIAQWLTECGELTAHTYADFTMKKLPESSGWNKL
jgi:hypothetical protein